MSVEGIDVSRWQTTTPSLTGLAFGIAKVSEGTWPDPRYEQHMAAFGSAGLVCMGYCFARDDVPILVQAAFFVENAGPEAEALVVDNEGGHVLTRAQLTALISAIKAADPLHRRVGEYMSASVYMNGCGEDFDWIADYRAGASTPSGTFHQWTSSPYDKDHFNGTLADLNQLVGRDVAAAKVTDLTPKNIVRSNTWYMLDGVTKGPGNPHSVGPSYSPYGVGNMRAFSAGGTLFLCIPTSSTAIPGLVDAKHAVTITVDGITKASVVV